MILLLLVAFLLELVAFFSIGAFAFLVQANIMVQTALYLLIFGAVIVFWGVFMSPKAPKKLPPKAYYLAKGMIYLVAAVALGLTFSPMIGLLFFAVWVIDELLVYFGQRRVG